MRDTSVRPGDHVYDMCWNTRDDEYGSYFEVRSPAPGLRYQCASRDYAISAKGLTVSVGSGGDIFMWTGQSPKHYYVFSSRRVQR